MNSRKFYYISGPNNNKVESNNVSGTKKGNTLKELLSFLQCSLHVRLSRTKERQIQCCENYEIPQQGYDLNSNLSGYTLRHK